MHFQRKDSRLSDTFPPVAPKNQVLKAFLLQQVNVTTHNVTIGKKQTNKLLYESFYLLSLSILVLTLIPQSQTTRKGFISKCFLQKHFHEKWKGNWRKQGKKGKKPNQCDISKSPSQSIPQGYSGVQTVPLRMVLLETGGLDFSSFAPACKDAVSSQALCGNSSLNGQRAVL